MRVGSLFSGGGLGDYGLELAGMEIAWQVEIDDYCQRILKLRWPDVPKWRDIREVKGADIPPVDLISGGFPCQDISIAGEGRGIEGSRSGLWKEMHRLICEIRPRYVLVENVTALLGRGIGVVLGDLASVGYDAEWECLSARAFGFKHERDRIWIVAYPTSERLEGSVSRLRESVFPIRQERIPIACPDIHKTLRLHAESKSLRNNDGSADWVDRLKLLGNGQVVQVVEWIGRQIIEFDRMSARPSTASPDLGRQVD